LVVGTDPARGFRVEIRNGGFSERLVFCPPIGSEMAFSREL